MIKKNRFIDSLMNKVKSFKSFPTLKPHSNPSLSYLDIKKDNYLGVERRHLALTEKNKGLVLVERDENGQIYYISPNVRDLLGVEDEDILSGKVALKSLLSDNIKETKLLETHMSGLNLETVSLVDISENLKNINKLKDLDQFFSKIFKNIPDLFLILDLELDKIVEVNSNLVKNLGFKRIDLVGKPLSKLSFAFAPFENEESYLKIKGKLQEESEGPVQNEIFNYRKKNGSLVSSRYSGSFISLEEKPLALILIKDMEHLLKQDEIKNEKIAEYQNIVKWALIGQWEWDILSNKMKWSEEVYEIMGMDPREMKQSDLSFDTLLKHVHKEDRHVFDTLSENLVGEKTHFSFKYRIHDRKGQEKHILNKIQICNDPETPEAPKLVKGLILDIT